MLSALLFALSTLAPGQRPAAESPATQLVVVTTPSWNAISGTLRRYARSGERGRWRAVGAPVPIVGGRTGLAWGEEPPRDAGIRKRFARAPQGAAGRFPLTSAFGFAPSAGDSIRMPYIPLLERTECVDDPSSTQYNRIVDRSAVSRVDWTSAERMRSIGVYRLGVTVDYNARPTRRNRGSCIFLPIWSGESSPTAGCTAMPAAALETVVGWLDSARHPMLVQLPAAEYARLRRAWSLP